jgi:hypothetical protein
MSATLAALAASITGTLSERPLATYSRLPSGVRRQRHVPGPLAGFDLAHHLAVAGANEDGAGQGQEMQSVHDVLSGGRPRACRVGLQAPCH